MADSTRASIFADSAIDMSVSPRSVKHTEQQSDELAPRFLLSDRLEQLTARVWKAEQDGRLDDGRSKILDQTLDNFDAQLQDEGGKEAARSLAAKKAGTVLEPEVGETQAEQLQEVLIHLSETISSMRLRRQEHRHLHSLSLAKMDTVAQSSHAQEGELKKLTADLRRLREESKVLDQDNQILRSRVQQLEEDATQREVAVDAMTGAVAGLDEWLAQQHVPRTPSPEAKRTSRRQVVRGRGRFRGKYYVDDLSDRGIGEGTDAESTARDLHDGVRSWLRGFKDVEEELRSPSRRLGVLRVPVDDSQGLDEDWGDFESPA